MRLDMLEYYNYLGCWGIEYDKLFPPFQ